MGTMDLDDDALALHIADVTAFDQELITHNCSHLCLLEPVVPSL